MRFRSGFLIFLIPLTGCVTRSHKPGDNTAYSYWPGEYKHVKYVDFNYKAYGNVANYFVTEKDMLDFFDFKKGDVAVEVGSSTGENIGGFSLLTDSMTFYLEDIDPKRLNQKKFNKVLKKCRKIKPLITNTFHLKIGTEKSTGLPDGIFDKIIIVNTLHEFTYMD